MIFIFTNVLLSFGEYNEAVLLYNMKTPIFYLLCLSMLFSCKSEHTLTFEPLTFKSETCANCPRISITIPKALGKNKISETINTALEEEIISLLIYDDEIEVASIQKAIASFKKGFHELQELYTDETSIWEATINGVVSYEDASIITIELNTYLFTGGAHGYIAVQFLNFDKKRGSELENEQLFIKKDDFQKYAEDQFRSQENISQDRPINDTGFMFDNNSFYLPENIGYTKEGLKLIYNQYEVASYADGLIELVLPYDEIKKYLILGIVKE